MLDMSKTVKQTKKPSNDIVKYMLLSLTVIFKVLMLVLNIYKVAFYPAKWMSVASNASV